MNLTPVPTDSPAALRNALERRGISSFQAEEAGLGLESAALVVDDVDERVRETLLQGGRELGIEVVSGEGWALVLGSASRMSGLIRPGYTRLPQDLCEGMGSYLRGVTHRPAEWSLARGTIDVSEPLVVGILNVTPDSFSDGGNFLDPGRAVDRAEELVELGTGMIDVGAESTRPGVDEPLHPDEEWERLGPVLRGIFAKMPDIPLSVDTVNGITARRALDAGAWAVNDVSGLRLDPSIAAACTEYGAGLVLMHSRGAFSDMASYKYASYEDVVAEVFAELTKSIHVAVEAGVDREKIAVDPGLGFGKKPESNYEILGSLSVFANMGHPLMVGPSRKRFLEAVTGHGVTERDGDTAAVCVACYFKGARLFRVHDAGGVTAALKLSRAIG